MSKGLAIELTLPFCWSEKALHDCQAVQSGNQMVYAMLAGYDDKAGSTTTERQPLHPELALIEAKLNVVLALLTHVVHQQTPLPAPLLLELSASHVAWQATATVIQTLIPAQSLVLTLHLDPRIPLPIHLCAQVESVATDGQVCVQLQHHDETQADAWERWLFRQHRRLIARSRH